MRALVTGGAGFIGSHLVPLLADRADELLVLDDLSVGTALPAAAPTTAVVTASLGDDGAAREIRAFAPDTVFHLAALHFIPWCEENPDAAEHANVEGTSWLLDVLAHHLPERIVFASSVAVYGFHDEPVTERMQRRPGSVYARTKVAGEDLLTAYARTHQDATIAMPRLANVYGPGDPNAHLLPSLVADLGGEVRVGNQWPERDYVHVSDVASALLAVARLPAGVHVHNVGTGVGTTVKVIVDTLAELAGVPMTVVSDPSRLRADDGHLVADPSALQRATGWLPGVELRAGLTNLLQSVSVHCEEVSVR